MKVYIGTRVLQTTSPLGQEEDISLTKNRLGRPGVMSSKKRVGGSQKEQPLIFSWDSDFGLQPSSSAYMLLHKISGDR